MDLEKSRKSFKWDPQEGDYTKSYISFERNVFRKKVIRTRFLTILYLLLLTVSIIIVINSF